MVKNKLKIIRSAIVASLIIINMLVITLMIMWTKYVEQYKNDTSSAVLSIIELSIINSDNNDIDNTCASIINYIGEIPNRRIAIYDEQYNLRDIYPNQIENFDIKDDPNLFESLKSADSGQQSININDHNEEVFWNWVTTKDGSRKLLIIYGMNFDAINEFSFVVIISYLLIIFILILTTSIYLNYRHDYFISLVKLYRLSSTYDN